MTFKKPMYQNREPAGAGQASACLSTNLGWNPKSGSPIHNQIITESLGKLPNMPGENFEEILNDAVDDAMSQLGETVKRTLSFYLSQSFNIKTEEIRQKTKEFDSAVNTLLGSGAPHLEAAILRNLSAKIDINMSVLVKSSEEPFPDIVNRAEELHRTHQTS